MNFEYYADRYVEGVIQICMFAILVGLLLPVMSGPVFFLIVLLVPLVWRGIEKGTTKFIRSLL